MNRRRLYWLFLAFPICGTVRSAEAVESCFEQLPIAWTVTKSFVVSEEQTARIATCLGGSIRRLTNTFLSVHGQELRVNVMHAASEPDAMRLHSAVSALKGHRAFCVRTGTRVVEFTGRGATVALATKVSYELGLVPKPTAVRYRVAAKLVTVERADYMSLNRLSNLLQSVASAPRDANMRREIGDLATRFDFGRRLTLRSRDHSTNGPRYEFDPGATGVRTCLSDEATVYSFEAQSECLGVPFVTLHAEITCNDTGVTRTTRQADASLLAATAFWPVDEPEIVATE